MWGRIGGSASVVVCQTDPRFSLPYFRESRHPPAAPQHQGGSTDVRLKRCLAVGTSNDPEMT